jgi:hypothetical protein
LQKPTVIIINQPRPRSLIKPVFVPKQLPSIKERTIKENLTQKATLKCKSPRPESAFSRSTTFVATESSHHPLQVLCLYPIINLYLILNSIWMWVYYSLNQHAIDSNIYSKNLIRIKMGINKAIIYKNNSFL